MTVKELKEALDKVPEDAEVIEVETDFDDWITTYYKVVGLETDGKTITFQFEYLRHEDLND